MGDDTYVKYKDYYNYRGDNVFDLIVTIDDISFGDDSEPVYDIVGLYSLRENSSNTDEELVELLRYSKESGYYDILNLPDYGHLRFAFKASGSDNGKAIMESFNKVFLDW